MEQAITVSSTWEEHTYLAEQRCSCGGDYSALRWELDFQDEQSFESVQAKCNSCGLETQFWFDITAALQPQPQDYIRKAWQVPRDGPYSIDEKGYREAVAKLASGSADTVEEDFRRGSKAILDKYFRRIAGRFQVHGLRHGGMGTAYLCVDTEWSPGSSLPYFVVCKTIESSSGNVEIEALKSEARIWSYLGGHPNIVQLFDVIALSPSRLVLVMEAVLPGPLGVTTVKEWIDHDLVSLPLALRFFSGLCKAMVHCQLQAPGFVHGDLKPENLLVARGHELKVTDLGLARARGFNDPFSKQTGGTFLYLAPECWEGTERSEKSDVYAAGVVGYEMLTGKCPFERKTSRGGLNALDRRQKVPPLDDPLIPVSIRNLLAQCLAQDPSRRPTFNDLLQGLGNDDLCACELDSSKTAAEWNNKGKALAQLGQHRRATDCYLRAVSLEPSNPVGWNNFAISLSILGDNARAEQSYTLSLALGENSAQTFANYAAHLVREGNPARLEEALSLCEKSLRLDSQNLSGLINKAAILNGLGRYPEAVKAAERATKIEPSHPHAWVELGTAYWKCGRRSKALKCAKQALKLDPTFGPAHTLKRLLDTRA
ncbi:MAG TPA: serine/threonine-protein kinase [Pyrinomonadaceae bacterium]|nr:serine/threonine-protein kinase [Pyrinomonadaceae bacterium]